MCRGWRFAEPQVPGAIAPVPATPDMTQEVGIRNCKLYTKPGDAVVSEFEERLEAVEDATADNTLEIDALDAAAVKSSNLQFNVDNPQGVTLLENIRYNGTNYVVYSGGGSVQARGVGTLRDEYASLNVGTFNYLIDGKIMLIRLQVDQTSWETAAIGLTLVGLPQNVSYLTQYFCAVDNVNGSSNVQPIKVMFFAGGVVGCVNAGVSYVTEMRKLNNYTFTLILN